MQISFAALPQSIKPQVVLRFSGDDDKDKTPLNQDKGRPDEVPKFTTGDEGDSFASNASNKTDDNKKAGELEAPPAEIVIDLDKSETSPGGDPLIEMMTKVFSGQSGGNFQVIELGGPNGLKDFTSLFQPQAVTAVPSAGDFEQGYVDAVTALATEIKAYQDGQDKDKLNVLQAHMIKSKSFRQSIQQMNENLRGLQRAFSGMNSTEYSISYIMMNLNAMVITLFELEGYEEKQDAYKEVYKIADLLSKELGLISQDDIVDVVTDGNTTKDRVFGFLNLINQAVEKSDLFEVNKLTVEGQNYSLITRKS